MSRLRSRSERRRVGAKSEGRLGGKTCLSTCGGRARRQGGGGDCPLHLRRPMGRPEQVGGRPLPRGRAPGKRRFSSPPMPNGSGSRPAGCAMRPRSRSFASVAAKASSAARSPKRRPTRALCGPRQGRRQRARGSGARARLWRVLPTGGVNVALRLPTAPTRGSTRAADRRASDRAVKGSHWLERQSCGSSISGYATDGRS